jgi:protein-S-isoprenylcysteine O-methyltransferase Ste14
VTATSDTAPKWISVLAFGLMVAGLGWLIAAKAIFARNPVLIAVQIAAALLMIAARVTFGSRSFHAAANPTAGGVVTTGPYRYFRHPIYAAVLYFIWATAVDHFGIAPVCAALLVTIGGVIRMVMEERLLVQVYPEYRDYMRRTRRVIPFVI